MTQIPKVKMIEMLKSFLKVYGFRKSKTTWHKITDDSILVLNIQGSQWGPEYYINLGVYLHTLGSELNPPVNLCHIQRRVEHNNRTVELMVDEAMTWFNTHGSIKELKRLNTENRLPVPVTK